MLFRSLVELLIGVLISTILVGAAVKALLALIQDDGFTQQELNRKDDTSRVLSLMQDEIRSSRRVDSGGSLSALSGCTTTPQLILRGATAKESISYGLKVQPSSSSWRGPNVLVRCGPPYNADGSLNAGTDQTPNRSEQEVLDALRSEFQAGPVVQLRAFLGSGKRGFTQERRPPPGAMLRIRSAEESTAPATQTTLRSKAG